MIVLGTIIFVAILLGVVYEINLRYCPNCKTYSCEEREFFVDDWRCTEYRCTKCKKENGRKTQTLHRGG